MHKKILSFIATFVVATLIIPTNIYATEHKHSDDCYSGTLHKHIESCYIDINAGGCGKDTITWVETKSSVGTCGNCGGTYKYSYMTGTCSGCKKTYTDTVYYACDTCEMVMTPFSIKENKTTYPKYPTTKCSYQTKGESMMQLVCPMVEGQYYTEDGLLATYTCSKVAVSIKPENAVQYDTKPNTTLIVTYLDGHTNTVQGTSDYDETKSYKNDKVTITYEGLVNNALTKGKLTTTITFTTKNTNEIQKPTNIPNNNTPTIYPPNTNIDGGNRLQTGNNSMSNGFYTGNNGSGYYSGGYNNGNSNQFTSNTPTRGEIIANQMTTNEDMSTNTEMEETTVEEPTPLPEKHEAVKVVITRPLTQEEKEELIDGTMILTKLYRNETNDIVGVKKITTSKSSTTVAQGSINQGLVAKETNEGKIMTFVLLGVIFTGIAGVGGVMVIKKQKEEQIETKEINLQDSLRM